MFVFYRLDDLILLNRLQILSRIAETGVKILVPSLSEANLSAVYWATIKSIARKGTIQIKDHNIPLEFFAEHEAYNKFAGKGLLMLAHFCSVENSILIINDEDLFVKKLFLDLGLQTYSLEEFNKATINNQEYFEFMMEIKKEQSFK